MKNLNLLIIITAMISFLGCDTQLGPNDIGGSSDVEFTKVGSVTSCYLKLGGISFNNVQDSVVVTKNENGIVTTSCKFVFDTSATLKLDTLLGTTGLSDANKKTLIETYLKKYDAKLDTSDKKALKLELTLKTKVTTEGIQEFMSSGGDLSKPYTMVKYSSSVGDKYEFTDKDGIKITRSVNYKSTTDDYPVAFWNIKVLKVVETKEDPLVEKIEYVFNHKFGIVGTKVTFKNGKIAEMGFLPPNM